MAVAPSGEYQSSLYLSLMRILPVNRSTTSMHNDTRRYYFPCSCCNTAAANLFYLHHMKLSLALRDHKTATLAYSRQCFSCLQTLFVVLAPTGSEHLPSSTLPSGNFFLASTSCQLCYLSKKPGQFLIATGWCHLCFSCAFLWVWFHAFFADYLSHRCQFGYTNFIFLLLDGLAALVMNSSHRRFILFLCRQITMSSIDVSRMDCLRTIEVRFYGKSLVHTTLQMEVLDSGTSQTVY